MPLTLTSHQEYNIYPGEYRPMPEIGALAEELTLRHGSEETKPSLNLIEYEDHYSAEVLMQGVRREEIFIRLDDNVLRIVALHKSQISPSSKLQVQQFTSDYFNHLIILPRNIDPEFIIAQYEAGILKLFIPKSTGGAGNIHTRIVVY